MNLTNFFFAITKAKLLAYDTAFQLNDIYLSMLTFQHTLFEEALVIPVVFSLHEQKLSGCHEQLFDVCCKLVKQPKSQ